MKKIIKGKGLTLILCLGFLFVACDNSEESQSPIKADPKNDLVIKSQVVITNSYVGNGFQWGGYDVLEAWTGSATLSDDDWNKLFFRVRFMKPQLVRIMVSPGWNYMINGLYNPLKSEPVLLKILDFCEQEGISVMFGEWGHQGGNSIDQAWLSNSVAFLDWLLNTRNYTCIKYFNMVNEPNGDWSSINGNYNLWRNLIEQFHAKLVEKSLDSRIKLVGPDIAIWDVNSTWWVTNTYSHLDSKMGAYDIHTYPNETVVRDATYQALIKAYKNAAPSTKEMLMGELGFKYSGSSTLGIENTRRINNDPFSSDDSNMFIYDAFYGIDMADAIIQNMLAGYSGVIVWNLDDAMYNFDGGSSTKLKRWGFWNILGEEKFGNTNDENIRPWFYTMSLMCKYFPEGTKILGVELPAKKGLRAVAGEKDGKFTIVIVNSHTVDYTVNLKMDNGSSLNNAMHYKYISGKGKQFIGKIDGNGFAVPEESGKTIDFTNDKFMQLAVPAQSFQVFTNMN